MTHSILLLSRTILPLNGGYVNGGPEPKTFAPGDRCIACSQVSMHDAIKPTSLYTAASFGTWQIHDVRVDGRSQLDADEFPKSPSEMQALVSGFDTVKESFEIEASFLGSKDRSPFYAALMGLVVAPQAPVNAYSGAIRLRGPEGEIIAAFCDGPARVPCNESAWFIARSDQSFRPERLTLAGHCQNWLLEDFHIKDKSQFISKDGIPGEAFHPDVPDMFMRLPFILRGSPFAIKARYIGSNPRGGRFGAILHGRHAP